MMASPRSLGEPRSRGVHPLYNPNDTIVIPLHVVFWGFFLLPPKLGGTTDIRGSNFGPKRHRSACRQASRMHQTTVGVGRNAFAVLSAITCVSAPESMIVFPDDVGFTRTV